jgi:hypothetical protein
MHRASKGMFVHETPPTVAQSEFDPEEANSLSAGAGECVSRVIADPADPAEKICRLLGQDALDCQVSDHLCFPNFGSDVHPHTHGSPLQKGPRQRQQLQDRQPERGAESRKN